MKNKQKVKEILKNMKSRGIRQRLRKRIEKDFGEIFNENTNKVVKVQKESGIEKKVKQKMEEYKNVGDLTKKKQKVQDKK